MSKSPDGSTEQRFTTRIGLIMSALGIAVGTGNIWRFPRIAAQNTGETGAGAFLIAWVIFLFLWSIPLIIAEYASGRKQRSGVIGVFIKGMGNRFAWVGSFVAFVPLAITFYYSVVVGWCAYYFIYTATHPLPDTFESAMLVWNNYQSGYWPIVTHLLAVSAGVLIIWKGIKSIEKANKFLIPSLLLVILICVVRAITLPGAGEGLRYLFTADLKQLGSTRTWIDALTQNAWDTGAGWGLFMTYATYMKKEHGCTGNAFMTGIGNNTVSLLAGIMIFGTVFSVLKHEMGIADTRILEIMRDSGPASTGLTFIWIPQLFNKMTGGGVLAVLFFLGLTFAGFSSLIAMLELPSRIMVDAGIKRNRAILIIAILVFVLGIPSARNLNFLSNQDFVWGVALMISGALIALMIIKQGVREVRSEINQNSRDIRLGVWWTYDIKWFVPFAALILIIWWLAQSFVPGEWFNPFSQFSFMSCIFQWGIVLILLVLFNKQIAKFFTHETNVS